MLRIYFYDMIHLIQSIKVHKFNSFCSFFSSEMQCILYLTSLCLLPSNLPTLNGVPVTKDSRIYTNCNQWAFPLVLFKTPLVEAFCNILPDLSISWTTYNSHNCSLVSMQVAAILISHTIRMIIAGHILDFFWEWRLSLILGFWLSVLTFPLSLGIMKTVPAVILVLTNKTFSAQNGDIFSTKWVLWYIPPAGRSDLPICSPL